MPLQVKQILSSGHADEADIRAVKSALNRLGLYAPDPEIGITGMTDDELFDGIRAFQKQKGLPVTGIIRPDDDTARALERAVEDVPFGQKYIWRTVQDDKVRSSHAARNGQVFTEGAPPSGGHPGEEYNCRCWREAVPATTSQSTLYPDAIEPVYPIEFILGLGIATKFTVGIINNLTQANNQRFMQIDGKQLQSKFYHAKDLGVKGNYNPQRAIEFKNSLDKHTKSPDVKVIKGTYQGKKATHYFNQKTNVNVIKDSEGNFWSVWRLSKEQAQNVLRNGKLGGGK